MKNSINLDIGQSVFKINKKSIGIDLIKEKKPDVTSSVLFLPFRSETFDSVTMLEVIEHLKEYQHDQAILEINRVLKSKHTLIISTPHKSKWTGQLWKVIWFMWKMTIQEEYRYGHVGELSEYRFIALLLRNHFRITSRKRVMLFDMILEGQKLF
jgi:ubiquinone/menaquinone biosynthesis C-methylase UbiE